MGKQEKVKEVLWMVKNVQHYLNQHMKEDNKRYKIILTIVSSKNTQENISSTPPPTKSSNLDVSPKLLLSATPRAIIMVKRLDLKILF